MGKKTGRPSKYTPQMCERIITYFDIEPYTKKEVEYITKKGKKLTKTVIEANDLPTLDGFCVSINIAKNTLQNWRKKYKDFEYACQRAKTLQKHIWLTNSFKGLYATAFTIFAGKNMFGWRDRQDITTGDKELAGPIPYLPPKDNE